MSATGLLAGLLGRRSAGMQVSGLTDLPGGLPEELISALDRRVPHMERAGEAVKHAKLSRIHVFCATSKIHREHKLRKGKEEIATFFEKVMKEDSERAQQCHRFLAELTQHGTSATSPQGSQQG